MQPTKEFYARIPASLAKDCKLSPTAKLLYVLLAVHADSRTGVTFVGLRTLERLLGCGRVRRQRAQRELELAGWVQLRRKSCARGRWGARYYIVSFCRRATRVPFQHCGEGEPYISSHSQVSPSQEAASAVP